MFHRAVLADKGLLLAFHKSFQALFLERWLVDLPVPVSFSVTPLLASVFARCFTVNHRGKPGPLPRLLFGRFHGCLDVLLCLLGTCRADLLAFCPGRVTRPTTPPVPSFSREIFFRTSAWSSANSNRDLPECPLSALTPAGVAFFTNSQHTGSWKLTDRQAESKLLAQAALFAHAWRW